MRNKSASQFTTDTSTLERIKSLELAIARRITLVQEEISHAQINAEARAIELRAKIEQDGKIEGENRYVDILATAQIHAQSILEQAQKESSLFSQHLPQLISQVKSYACQLILGVQDKE